MNRAERRKAERNNKRDIRKNEVRLTEEELNEIKERVSDAASITSVDILMTCFALAEHRMHGFGKKRIRKTIDYIDELVEGIVNGDSTIDEYKKELKEEADVTIVARR